MASPISTHSKISDRTASINNEEPSHQDNGLYLEGAPFKLEHIYDYEQGGLHPVHLGDCFGSVERGESHRYRVIHKLGHGGFATVWLCVDTKVHDEKAGEKRKRNGEGEGTKYVALKILMDEVSRDECPELRILTLNGEAGAEEFLALPLEYFMMRGPNGEHLVFVYPVLGPNVSQGYFETFGDRDRDLRGIALQVAKAAGFLHSKGICHGDITPNNILHCITGLDGLTEDEALEILGRPTTTPVLDSTQTPPCTPTVPNAPHYLVYPIDWSAVDIKYISRDSRLIDFGESFKITQPPENLGVPIPYRAPELIFDKKAGIASDLWALGCTLFGIRTGRKLFDPFDDDDDTDLLILFVEILGKMPEPWWSTSWRDRVEIFKDDVDELGHVVPTKPPVERVEDPTVTTHPCVAKGSKSLKDKVAAGVWYLGQRPPNDHREIEEREQVLFADLLGRLLVFEVGKRWSAEKVASHEWFGM